MLLPPGPPTWNALLAAKNNQFCLQNIKFLSLCCYDFTVHIELAKAKLNFIETLYIPQTNKTAKEIKHTGEHVRA